MTSRTNTRQTNMEQKITNTLVTMVMDTVGKNVTKEVFSYQRITTQRIGEIYMHDVHLLFYLYNNVA